MIYINLKDIDNGTKNLWPLFSTTSNFALTSLSINDHMINGDRQQPLDIRVRNLVEERTGTRPAGPIFMLGGLRVCGIGFEPVNFYYVYDDDGGEKVVNVVAQVNNIPWFEQHCYVLSPKVTNVQEGGVVEFTGHAKDFHVSPFMDSKDINYQWFFKIPGDSLKIKAGLEKGGENFFMASLDLKRRLFSARNLIWLLVTMPMLPLKVVLGILYEALKLWNRGFTFYPHPDGTETMASRVLARIMSCCDTMKTCPVPNNDDVVRQKAL